MTNDYNIYNKNTPEQEAQAGQPSAPATEPAQQAEPAQAPIPAEPSLWAQPDAAEDAGPQDQTAAQAEPPQTAGQEAARLVQPIAPAEDGAPQAAPFAAAENTQPGQFYYTGAGAAHQTQGGFYSASSQPPYGQAAGGYQSPYTGTGTGGYYGAGASHWPQPPAPPKAPGHNNVPQNNGKKKRGWLGGIALVLACAVAGFGGGALANDVFGNRQQSVVYKSAERSEDGAGGVSTPQNLSVSDIAAKAGASVVSITTENLVTDQFFTGRVVSGAGSGVIISEDGYIITNNHVIDGARSIKVTLQDGTEYDASIVGGDATSDIAMIKVQVTGLTPAVVSDSDALLIGDFCLAIGNPMGTLGGTVTNGIISALNRELTIDGNTMTLLQTNAAVSPGNSGGGLFDANGELIGIVNAKSSSNNSEGLGFAIPVNTAMKVANDLMTKGFVSGRPGLGISVVSITTPQQAQQAQVSEPGVYVAQVTPGGAAEQAGVQVGDMIATIDGQEVSQYSDISTVLQSKQVGDSVALRVLRDGEPQDITVVLQELAGQTPASNS